MKLFHWLLVFCVIAAVALAAGAGYLFGQGAGRSQAAVSCAQLGVAYLELGKRELGIVDFDSPEWQALIERETQLVNDCTVVMAGSVLFPVEGEINSFEDCVAAGFPILESFPEQCITPDGLSFTNEVGEVPVSPTTPETPPMVACTMEAKICPDGSSVGRSGPNCEFAACPGE